MYREYLDNLETDQQFENVITLTIEFIDECVANSMEVDDVENMETSVLRPEPEEDRDLDDLD